MTPMDIEQLKLFTTEQLRAIKVRFGGAAGGTIQHQIFVLVDRIIFRREMAALVYLHN